MTELLTPVATAVASRQIPPPSLSFRKQVSKVIFSIILFLIVYFLLVLVAIGLAILCFYAGVAIILAMPGMLTIILGLGLMCVGISVIFFLVKFVFAVSKDQKASRVEITKNEEPRLFAFIRELSKQTQTPFPKKIFISPDVNASVFYNSGFWSMFLPVRKNLEIGLGLVNSLHVSEFKAVVAHEFGHFSQRSMKLGSFTYNVNRVIYNMLYFNSGYTRFLNAWGRIHGYLALFARLTAGIANGIQSILREMYKFVNKNYLGLSREMEFHADAVAASVCGGNNLISALNRISIADDCYSNALQNADKWVKENKVSKNIFSNQLSILRYWAKENQLPLKEGLPEVSYQFIKAHSASRVNYKNQWASHPTLEERTTRLEELSMPLPCDNESAWQLFSNPEHLQEQLTKNLYQQVKLDEHAAILDGDYFAELHEQQKEKFTLSPKYNGFYSNRYVDVKDWEPDAVLSTAPQKMFEELFTTENGGLQSAIQNNENDLAMLKAISEKRIDVKTFDFDGVKHKSADAKLMIESLEKDIEDQRAQQQSLDKAAFAFFCRQAKDKKYLIKEGYGRYQSVCSENDEYTLTVNRSLDILRPFYEGKVTLDKITLGIAGIKSVHEPAVKKTFRKLLQDGVITATGDEKLCERVNHFINSDNVYFAANNFRNEELNEFRDLIVRVADEFNEYKFRVYKEVLEEQLAVVDHQQL